MFQIFVTMATKHRTVGEVTLKTSFTKHFIFFKQRNILNNSYKLIISTSDLQMLKTKCTTRYQIYGTIATQMSGGQLPYI